jgi:hypothetical protein
MKGEGWAISQVADRIDGKATAEIQTEQRHRYVIEAPAEPEQRAFLTEPIALMGIAWLRRNEERILSPAHQGGVLLFA